MNVKKKIVVAGTSALLATGLGVGAVQLATADPTQTPSPNPSSTTTSSKPSQSPSDTDDRGNHGNRGPRDSELAKQLASKLGLDESKVTTALQEAHKALRENDNFRDMTPEQRHTELAKQLASKLGVEESKVKTALDEIHKARQAQARTEFKSRLDQAVKDGKLTQTEADAVLKAWDAGLIGGGAGRR